MTRAPRAGVVAADDDLGAFAESTARYHGAGLWSLRNCPHTWVPVSRPTKIGSTMRAAPSMMSRKVAKSLPLPYGRREWRGPHQLPSPYRPRSCESHPARNPAALVRVIMFERCFWHHIGVGVLVGLAGSIELTFHGADIHDVFVAPGCFQHERLQAGVENVTARSRSTSCTSSNSGVSTSCSRSRQLLVSRRSICWRSSS